MPPTKTGIYEAIPKIMALVGHVGKDHKNPSQGYQYRAVDDVMASLQPALVACGVFVYPKVTALHTEQVQIGQKQTPVIHVVAQIEYHFCAADGSEIVACTIGEATDSADKAGNKAMASAYKYAVTQTLSIPTSEPKDTELDHPELTGTGEPPAKKNTKTPQAPPEMAGEAVPSADDF